MFARWIVAFVTSLLFSSAAHAEDATALMARFKDASGGKAWDRVTTLHASGTIGAGGMSGEVTLAQDLSTGRSADAYKLGPVEGADGFTVAFDYANKRLYFAPNASYGKPDAFDRSGFFLIADQNALVVADVARESAAAKAGFATNDRIVAIDGAPADRKSLVEWRAKLRDLPAGTKLEVDRVRDGKKATVELVLADRIRAA